MGELKKKLPGNVTDLGSVYIQNLFLKKGGRETKLDQRVSHNYKRPHIQMNWMWGLYGTLCIINTMYLYPDLFRRQSRNADSVPFWFPSLPFHPSNIAGGKVGKVLIGF